MFGLGIGDVVLDKTYILETNLQSNSKIKVIKSFNSVGGPALIGCLFLKMLNYDCHFIGAIGEDPPGRIIKQVLIKNNLPFTFKKINRTKTNTVIIPANNGERTILYFNQAAFKRKKLAVNQSNRNSSGKKIVVGKLDFLLVDRHQLASLNSIRHNINASTLVISDPSNQFNQEIDMMLRLSSIIVVPVEFLGNFCRKNKKAVNCFKMLYDIYKKPIIITRGHKSTLLISKYNIRKIQTFKINPVDTTGAGDIFRGALVYALLEKLALEKAVLFANAIAASHCLRYGNSTAIVSSKVAVDIFNSVRIGDIEYINEILQGLELRNSLYRKKRPLENNILDYKYE